MRRFFSITAFSILALLFVALPVYANDANDTAYIAIGERQISFADKNPVIVDGNLLAPVRDVFEALGFIVVWLPDTRQAVLHGGGHSINITVDSNVIVTNNFPRNSAVPAQILDGRLMVHLEPVLESLGYIVNFPSAFPAIYGVYDMEVYAGRPILFMRGVSARDGFGDYINAYVLRHNVNQNVPGVYYAIYTAVDRWGLRSQIMVEVRVVTVRPETVTEMVDELLSQILRDDMTQVQEARAIFDWISRNITYAASVNLRSVYEGAYQALRNRRGDCFTFYSIAELMLTRADIPNMRITRVGGTNEHFWNLINPDGLGWHHFDATPVNLYAAPYVNRFMFTSSEAAAFTEIIRSIVGHTNYYTYDPAQYPEIVQ